MHKILIALILISTIFISGCSIFSAESSHIEKSLKQDCTTSSVLITDLTQNQPKIFQLPDGRKCKRNLI